MLTSPRDTVRRIVERDPRYVVLPLAALSGIDQVLERASGRGAGDTLDLTTILLMAVVAGPLGGLLSLFVGALLLRWTGSWLGGRAPALHVRTAMAWGSLPAIYAMVLWVPSIAVFGRSLFTSELPSIGGDASRALLFDALIMAEVVVAVWSFVVFLHALGEVQGFSAWRALGNVFLAVLVVVIPVLFFVFGVGLLAIA